MKNCNVERRGIGMIDSLLCPKCGCTIEVSAVLASQVREHLEKEFEAEATRKDTEFRNREKKIGDRERLLASQQQALEESVSRRVAEAKADLIRQAELK